MHISGTVCCSRGEDSHIIVEHENSTGQDEHNADEDEHLTGEDE